jgi:hypothetical protein
MTEAVVSIKNICAYGLSEKYPANDVSKKTLLQWAVECKTELIAHPKLNEQKRLLKDSISEEAMEALWASTNLEDKGVAKDYPTSDIANARTPARLAERCRYHIEWLESIIRACAPETTVAIASELRAIKFGEGATGGATGKTYQADDVSRYMARVLKLFKEKPVTSMLSEKAVLEIVTHSMPTIGLKNLIKATLPMPAPGAPAPKDNWKDAMVRLAKELRTSEERAQIQDAIQLKGTGTFQETGRPRRPPPTSTPEKLFGKISKRRRRANKDGKPFPKWSANKDGKGRPFDGQKREHDKKPDKADVTCFNCNEKGHYASECPKLTQQQRDERSKQKGKGKGKGKGATRGGGKSGGSVRFQEKRGE